MMIYEPTESEIFHYGGVRHSHLYNRNDQSLCAAVAGGYRRDLGMRMAAMGGKGVKRWENPYVTDGLVAMYDGVWKLNGLVETASANEIRDIWGDHASIDVSSRTKGANYFGNKQYDEIAITIPELDETKSMSVYCVAGYNKNNSEQLTSLFASSLGSIAFQGYTYGMLTVARKDSANNGYYSQDSAISANTRYSFALSTLGYSHDAYRNGNRLTTQREFWTYAYNFSNLVKIGNASRPGFFYIYTMLIYIRNTKLTQAEVSKNYAVDRVRFGLP